MEPTAGRGLPPMSMAYTDHKDHYTSWDREGLSAQHLRLQRSDTARRSRDSRLLTGMSHFHLHRAATWLAQGGVIAYPTEAVFGLGCDPYNEAAVQRLLAIKQRSMSKGLILIASSFSQLQPLLAHLSSTQQAILNNSWPGPITWLIPTRPQTPTWLRGHYHGLAVRVTAHPIAAALCTMWGGPLVSTSANLSGQNPARNTLTTRRQLGRWIDYIVPGKVGNAERPTQIRDLLSGKVIRK